MKLKIVTLLLLFFAACSNKDVDPNSGVETPQTEEEIQQMEAAAEVQEEFRQEDAEAAADDLKVAELAESQQGTQIVDESYDFDIPETFDWDTYKEVEIEISGADLLQYGDTHVVEVYSKDDLNAKSDDSSSYELIDAGYISSTRPFRTKALILSTIDELVTVIRGVGGVDKLAVCSVAGSDVSDQEASYSTSSEIEDSVDLTDVIYSDHIYTVAFEDLLVNMDMDMNDVVARWQYGCKRDTDNKVTGVTLKYSVVAVGASKQIAAAIRANNLSESNIESVTINGTKDHDTCDYFDRNDKGFEVAGEEIIIPLFNHVHRLFYTSGTSYVNVATSGNNSGIDPYTFEVEIKFVEPISSIKFTPKDIDFFIVVGGTSTSRSELHLFGKHPTVKTSLSIDFTQTCQVWGMQLPSNYRWSLESKKITTAYPNFELWATSGGVNSQDWYNYPEESKVY